MFPHRGIHDAWIGRVHRQIGRAGFVVDLQDSFPRGAAVLASIDAALLAGAPDLALYGNVNEVRVPGVHDDAGDLSCIGQANMFPGRAGIRGLVHAVTVTGRDTPDGRLARAYVDDIDVGIRNGNRTNRADTEIFIGNVLPGNTRIPGLPDTATGRSHVIEPVIARHAGDRRDPPAAPGADLSPLETFVECRVNGVCCPRFNGKRQRKENG